MRWRQGRKVGQHVYLQTGDEPSDSDAPIAFFTRAEDAEFAVTAANEHWERHEAAAVYASAEPTAYPIKQSIQLAGAWQEAWCMACGRNIDRPNRWTEWVHTATREHRCIP